MSQCRADSVAAGLRLGGGGGGGGEALRLQLVFSCLFSPLIGPAGLWVMDRQVMGGSRGGGWTLARAEGEQVGDAFLWWGGGGGREAGVGRSPFEGSGVPLPWPETASSGPHGPAALAGPSGKGCVLPPVPPPHTSFHETGSETRQGLGL